MSYEMDPRDIAEQADLSARSDERAKTQAFFAAFVDSIRPVHVGEERKAFVREMILRATEAGLFQPEAK